MSKRKKKKEPTEKRKVGRPSSFNEILRSKILELAKEGKTNEQIAKIINVPLSTLQYWKRTDQEFMIAVRENKAFADDLVEASLFRRAVGYEHEAVKVMQHEGDVIVEPYTEHHPPDVKAAQFWLMNRRPEKWREKKEVELSGRVEGPLQNKTNEELERMLESLNERLNKLSKEG